MECPQCKSTMDGEARILATGCGHLFHEGCLRSWILSSTDTVPVQHGAREFSCPQCRDSQLELNCHRVFLPAVSTAASDAPLDAQVTRALAAKNQEILRLTREVARLKLEKRDAEAAASTLEADNPGSRVGFHKNGGRVYMGSFSDSTCLNCESNNHDTRDCPNQCIIRAMDKTTFDKWHPKEVYKYLAEMPGPMAGSIVSFFEVDHHMGRLSRTGLQIVFATHFFGDACWRCGSPYHVHLECDQNEDPDPGLKTVARRVHLIVKPLTEEQRLAKIARYEDNIRAKRGQQRGAPHS